VSGVGDEASLTGKRLSERCDRAARDDESDDSGHHDPQDAANDGDTAKRVVQIVRTVRSAVARVVQGPSCEEGDPSNEY
jgi:hypothetical protein